jgi:hypothetical protein
MRIKQSVEQYDFFIVRVWRRDGENGEQWTARLERRQGQESWRFSDADTLLAYLHGLIGPRNGPVQLADGSIALEMAPLDGADPVMEPTQG